MQSNGKEELLSKKKNNDLVLEILLKSENQVFYDVNIGKLRSFLRRSKTTNSKIKIPTKCLKNNLQ